MLLILTMLIYLFIQKEMSNKHKAIDAAARNVEIQEKEIKGNY